MGDWSVIYSNGKANRMDPTGTTVLPLELAASSQSLYFPFPFLSGLLNNPDVSLQTGVVSTISLSETPRSVALRVTVSEAKRLTPTEVELHITLQNGTDHDIYIPTYGHGKSRGSETARLTVYHWDANKGWRPLGSGSEFPPDYAVGLHPGESHPFVCSLEDPAITHFANEGIPSAKIESVPLRGIHKVRIGFYGSKREWQTMQEYAAFLSGKGTRGKKPSPPPQLKFVDSGEFDIPPPKS
jgi:hypothetical protein